MTLHGHPGIAYTGMDFAGALQDLKDGYKVTRASWLPAGQYVVLQPGYPDGIAINANTSAATGIPEGTVRVFQPYLMLHTADGSFVPWQPTVTDLLATDWFSASPDGGTITWTLPDGEKLTV